MAGNQFIEAVKALDLNRVRTLIDKDRKWLAWNEPSGKNALHYLCGIPVFEDAERQEKGLAILRFLLGQGMDMNAVHPIEEKNCGYFPATPLWYSYAKGRNEKIWKYLLKIGADPSNCWWAIAWYDDVPAAKMFLKNRARLDKGPGLDELFLGSFGWKKYAFAYWLLTMGAEVNARDPQGNTALIIAVKRKDEDNIAKLKGTGADADQMNDNGESARSIAQAKGPKRLLNLL